MPGRHMDLRTPPTLRALKPLRKTALRTYPA